MQHSAQTHEVVLKQGWLSRTPPLFQYNVLDRCRPQHFSRGETIYSIGDPPGGIYGLIAGGLGIFVAPRERGPYVARFARPGDWFGEAAAITDEPRRVGLAATRDTDLLHLPLHAIHEIVSRDPAAWRLFATITIGHLDSSVGGYDDLMIRDPVKRCIAILLRLAGCRLALPPTSSSAEIDLSQADIAELANVARTTLNAVLQKLEQTGKLERTYRRIRILAPNAMRAMLHD